MIYYATLAEDWLAYWFAGGTAKIGKPDRIGRSEIDIVIDEDDNVPKIGLKFVVVLDMSFGERFGTCFDIWFGVGDIADCFG